MGRVHWMLVPIVAAACGPGAPVERLGLQELVLAEPGPTPSLVREAAGATAGGADLHVPGAVRWVDGTVWVVDRGNDRLVRFDSALARARAFGREGEGPGELRFATDLAVGGGRLFVAETGNGRVSVFDTAGAFLESVPTPGVPKSVVRAGSDLFIAPGSAGTYAARIDGEARAAIPDAIARVALSDPETYPPADAFIGSDGMHLHVLDPSVLAVASFEATGRLRGAWLLPEPFRARLLARRRDEMEAWGDRAAAFVSVPATKPLSMDDRGRMLVPFALPDHWGLLIDPEDGTAQPLPLPGREPDRTLLRTASEAVLHGQRLFVVSQGRLYRFHFGGAP